MRFNGRKMLSPKIDRKKSLYDVTLASIINDVICGFYLSILGDGIFCILEPILVAILQSRLS